jgi:hypothetical protein
VRRHKRLDAPSQAIGLSVIYARRISVMISCQRMQRGVSWTALAVLGMSFYRLAMKRRLAFLAAHSSLSSTFRQGTLHACAIVR